MLTCHLLGTKHHLHQRWLLSLSMGSLDINLRYFIQNTKRLYHNLFVNAVLKISTILFSQQCVNPLTTGIAWVRILSTVTTDAPPGLQYPQYWQNIRYIQPVLHKNIIMSINTIRKYNYTFWKKSPVALGLKRYVTRYASYCDDTCATAFICQ